MSLFDSFLYGLIQGITEFLPVSSSAHLALLPKFLNIADPGVFFDLAMHVGTALAVMVYFRNECKKVFLSPRSPFSQNFLISTFFTVAIALPLKPIAEQYGRNPTYIAFNLAFFGILMMIADKVGGHPRKIILKKDLIVAATIGLFQAIALFPGVSRSGITLTVSRLFNISRLEASRYSFLLSLPLIAGGFLIKSLEALKNPVSFSIEECLFGLSISFIVGLLTIHFFLKVIQKLGLISFGFYRIFIAALIWYYLVH